MKRTRELPFEVEAWVASMMDEAVMQLQEDGGIFDIATDDTEPSAWDPEPVLSAVGHARLQAAAFEARERDRMRDGFYLDAPTSEVAEAEAEEAPSAPTEAPAEPGFPELTYEQARSRRERAVPPHTIRVRQRDLELGRRLYPETDHHRPRTRAACGEERPCPFVSCEYHLYLDVSRRAGAIKLNFPDLEVEDMAETCALDLAERGGEPGSGQGSGLTRDVVARHLNMTREGARQMELSALAKLKGLKSVIALRDDLGVAGSGARRHVPEDEAPDDETDDGEERRCREEPR